MICATVFLALCATVFAATDDEEDTFDKWDGIGLGVSIGVLALAAIFLYVKEFVLCPPDDILDEEEVSKVVDVGAPNPEAVDSTFMELFKELDLDKNHSINQTELAALVGSQERAKEILRKFDLDKTGDLSVFELQNFYKNDPEKAREDLERLRKEREEKKRVKDTTGSGESSVYRHEDDLKRDPTGSRKSSMGDPTKMRKYSMGGKDLDYSVSSFAEVNHRGYEDGEMNGYVDPPLYGEEA